MLGEDYDVMIMYTLRKMYNAWKARCRVRDTSKKKKEREEREAKTKKTGNGL